MSGYVRRDLAALDPWEASLRRSRARRRRAAGRSLIGRSAPAGRPAKLVSTAGRGQAGGRGSNPLLAAPLDARRQAVRDLSDSETWELSLGRSRARRRAAELRFVPSSIRARRASLGALVALTAAPVSGLLDSSGAPSLALAAPVEPTTTTQHYITLRSGSEGRQVRLLQQALGIPADGIYGPETEAAVRRFQETRGLTADGVLGGATSRALANHAPPTLSGAAVIRDLTGEAHEPAPDEVQETATTTALPASGATTGTRALAEGEGSGEVPRETPAPKSETGLAPGESFGGTTAPGESEGEAAAGGEREGPEASTGASTGTGAVASAITGSGGTAGGAGAAAGAGSTATGTAAGSAGASSTGTSAGATVTGTAAGTANADAAADPAGAAGAVTAGAASAEVGAVARASALAAQRAAAAEALAETDAVKHLQAALRLPVDGEFGPETEAAIRRLQARHGLAVDGVAGAATWRVLGQHGQPT